MATNSSKSASSGTASGSTSAAYQSGRSASSRGISGNPVAALAGGFAVGAVIGAVLPASRRERDALQPLGLKVSEAARGAARQAAETGRDKLNRLTGEVVTQVGSKVVDAVAPPKE